MWSFLAPALLLCATAPVEGSSASSLRGYGDRKLAANDFFHMRGLADLTWGLGLMSGYPTIDFETGREVELQYNYTGVLGDTGIYSKMLSFQVLTSDCDLNSPVDPNDLAMSEALGQDPTQVLSGNGLVDLFVDINQATIKRSETYSETDDGTEATIQFCVRADYLYDDESINFHEVSFTVYVDLLANFTLTDVLTDREDAMDVNEELLCEVEAYFCDDEGALIPDAILTQGDDFQFCVEAADTTRFLIKDILETDLEQDNNDNSVYREAGDEFDDLITDSQVDALTAKECVEGFCRVKTQLKSKYFSDPRPNPLDVFGVAQCELGVGSSKRIKPTTRIQRSVGFPCDNTFPFELNYDADPEYPQYLPKEDGSDSCFLRMTPDTATARASSAFLNFTFDESNALKTFAMSIGYRVYGQNAGSADGMAFVMHQDDRGTNALGGTGGQMGVYARGEVEGIKPAIVVEWDTHYNQDLLDEGEDRIHIIYVAADGSMTELAETGLLPIRTNYNGRPGRMWVEYCDDEILRVYINNIGNTKPNVPNAIASVSLNEIFGGNEVVVGYTASTFGAGDYHDVYDWSMEQEAGTCDPIPEPSEEITVEALAYSEITATNGFPCATLPFTINRGTNPVDLVFPSYVPYEDEIDLCFLRMTPDEVAPRASSAFLDFVFDETNTEKAFSMNIGYRIYGDQAGSADGMAFVMHQDERGINAVGEPGGAMGVYGSAYNRNGASEGIHPALVIEWDTHPNQEYLDESENRIHVMYVDENGTMIELAETEPLPIRTLDDGSVSGRMWVDYCDGTTLRMYINPEGDEKPLLPQAEVSVGLASIFPGSDVVVGYTAGTWAQADYQDILDWTFTQTCPVEL